MTIKKLHIVEADEHRRSSVHFHHDYPPLQNVLINRSTTSSMVRPVSPLVTDLAEEAMPIDSADSIVRLNEQQEFLLFVKIYSVYIKRTDTAAESMRRFKAIVSKCTAENRKGNSDYMPLQQVLQKKLFKEIGELHWNKIQYILQVYCREKRVQLDSLCA